MFGVIIFAVVVFFMIMSTAPDVEGAGAAGCISLALWLLVVIFAVWVIV